VIDSWTWFRERSDAELGETPEPELDRLSEAIVHADAVSRRRQLDEPELDRLSEAIVHADAVSGRRQLAQMIAAGAMVVVSLALVGVTVNLGVADRAPSSGPGLPVPQEEAGTGLSSRAATASPTPLPSPVARVDPSRPAAGQQTFRPRATLTVGRPVPTQPTGASATVPVATTPPATPPKPSATTPQSSPSNPGPSSTPTTSPTQTTSPPTPTGGA
jgi:hypothetical protein